MPKSYEEEVMNTVRNKSEVINDSLWYVNPDDIREALSLQRKRDIQKIRKDIESKMVYARNEWLVDSVVKEILSLSSLSE
jgi:hypothetical protein